MEENKMQEKEKSQSLVLEVFDSVIQDPVEKKILRLIIEKKSPEEILDELLYEEEKL